MCKSLSIKLFLIIFINTQVLLYPLGNQKESHRTFKIWNSGEMVGILKEKREDQKGFIKYEKHLRYISGEHINSEFRIKSDFSYFNGKILKNGKEQVFITNRYIKTSNNGNIKSYKLPSATLPSSIMHLYIHDMLKKGNELPNKMSIFYENTGDILDVKIKKINRERCIEIKYFFDKIKIQFGELFFPEKDAYFIQCDPIYFIDERLENEIIPWVKNEIMEQNNIVPVFEEFMGFSNATSILYKLTLTSNISIPKDCRQNIINERKNGGEKTFLLKVTRDNVIRSEEYTKKYNEYLLSFNFSAKIKKLTNRITRNTTDQREKIEKIMEWIKENINPLDNGSFEPEIVLKSKKGDCQGISNLFLTMCSALKIPGRAVIGVIILNQNKNYFYSFHQWVEVWEEDHWVPYDPTFGLRGIGLNYIKLLNLEKKLDLLKLINVLKNLKIEIIEEEQ